MFWFWFNSVVVPDVVLLVLWFLNLVWFLAGLFCVWGVWFGILVSGCSCLYFGDLGFVIVATVTHVVGLVFDAIKWCFGRCEFRFVGVLVFVVLLDFADGCLTV